MIIFHKSSKIYDVGVSLSIEIIKINVYSDELTFYIDILELSINCKFPLKLDLISLSNENCSSKLNHFKLIDCSFFSFEI